MTDNLAFPQRVRNSLIAVAAIVLSVVLFLAVTQNRGGTSLEQQAQGSVPLAAALANPKPTIIEFYANWCTSCQAMAADLATLKANHAADLNFVMLNVDNPNWLPEILRYDVDGIPHLVYLNGDGETVAQAIGEQPLSVLSADADALIAGEPLPYAQAYGQNPAGSTSTFAPPTPTNPTDPRSHGAFAS